MVDENNIKIEELWLYQIYKLEFSFILFLILHEINVSKQMISEIVQIQNR